MCKLTVDNINVINMMEITNTLVIFIRSFSAFARSPATFIFVLNSTLELCNY
jgi:hypothetical protein